MVIALAGQIEPLPDSWKIQQVVEYTPGVHPDVVVLDHPAAPGFLGRLHQLRSEIGGNRVRFAAWSPAPTPREVFICHNAGLELLGPEAGVPTLGPVGIQRPFPEVDNLAFANSLAQNLTQSFLSCREPSQLLWFVRNAVALVANPDMVVFLLHGRPHGEVKVFAGPGFSTQESEYFLRFCQQDFLDTDRFVDLEAMQVEYLEQERRQLSAAEKGTISSYWFAVLTDQGKPLGTLHLGSSRNQYFTPLVQARLDSLVEVIGPLVGLMRRDAVLERRLGSIRSLFAKFLPETVIEGLLANESEGRAEVGRKQELAILFSDIRSFTTLTERNKAEGVVQFLNHHFDAMVAQITAHGGVVDKFIGDAIVAVFGMEPGSLPPAEAAVRAARAMIAVLPSVDVSGLQLDGGTYRIGIGLHFGEVVLGYLGSDEKTAFTVIGQPIETAEHLESSTKGYQVDILLSEAIRSRVDVSDLPFRALGRMEIDDGQAFEVYTT